MKKPKATTKSLPLKVDIEKRKPTATIKSLALEVDIMIMGWLPLRDALNLAEALRIPEQVAAQYSAFDDDDSIDILYSPSECCDLQPSSFKFLLKNKSFQVEADSNQKTVAAVKTKDLDFLKNYLEEFKVDLNDALETAAGWGFTDAVKLLLSDDRVDPSVKDNAALVFASQEGHLEIVKLLLKDKRVNPSAQNNAALINALQHEDLEILKILLADYRVDPSAQGNRALIAAAEYGHFDIVKLLLRRDRVDPSVLDNRALISAALVAHSEVLEKVRHYILTFRFNS
jgi:hypothetical protein